MFVKLLENNPVKEIVKIRSLNTFHKHVHDLSRPDLPFFENPPQPSQLSVEVILQF